MGRTTVRHLLLPYNLSPNISEWTIYSPASRSLENSFWMQRALFDGLVVHVVPEL